MISTVSVHAGASMSTPLTKSQYVQEIGGESKLEQSPNVLSYRRSKYENMKAGFPTG